MRDICVPVSVGHTWPGKAKVSSVFKVPGCSCQQPPGEGGRGESSELGLRPPGNTQGSPMGVAGRTCPWGGHLQVAQAFRCRHLRALQVSGCPAPCSCHPERGCTAHGPDIARPLPPACGSRLHACRASQGLESPSLGPLTHIPTSLQAKRWALLNPPWNKVVASPWAG